MNLLDSITTTIPLSSGEDGVIRIGNTRVTLETLVYVFKNGFTAEEIVYQYPVLDLSDVYAVISYYLKHQAEVEAYMYTSRVTSEQIKPLVQEKYSPVDVRQRLLARAVQLPKIDA
jgi:uncharacterized protein (DUF433 family)